MAPLSGASLLTLGMQTQALVKIEWSMRKNAVFIER